MLYILFASILFVLFSKPHTYIFTICILINFGPTFVIFKSEVDRNN